MRTDFTCNRIILMRLLSAFALSGTLALASCKHDEPVAPVSTTTTVDDHGGHGGDDPAGDDNGGGG